MHSKLITLGTLIVGLTIALILAIQVGQGEFQTVYITTVLLFSIPILLFMGLRSWYTLPFAMLAELPALPLFAGRSVSLSEMCVVMFSGLMTMAVLQGRKKFVIKLGDWWPMLIYAGWVLMIAVINGGGFAILGSAAIGGRRYLTVLLAIMGMLMLSQMSIGEKEAKRVCWLICISMILSGIYLAGSALLGRLSNEGVYAFYSWQQSLSFISLGGIFLLFARYKPSEIILSPWKAFLYLLLLAIAAYAGKRMAFAACCVIPLISCFWHRQAIVAVAIAMMGSVGIIGVIAVQNEITAIPRSLQRVLAFIPADWDHDVEQSTDNIFRDTLNRWAMIKVRERPIFGKGVTLTVEDHSLMLNPQYVSQIKFSDDDVQAFPHIAGKNWHSTWLGLSATFGIPAAIAWIFVQLFVLRRSWILGHRWGLDVWCKTLTGMIFFFMFFGIMRSLSSGDVAVLAMGGGLYLGLMSAIKNGIHYEERELQGKEGQSVNQTIVAVNSM